MRHSQGIYLERIRRTTQTLRQNSMWPSRDTSRVSSECKSRAVFVKLFCLWPPFELDLSLWPPTLLRCCYLSLDFRILCVCVCVYTHTHSGACYNEQFLSKSGCYDEHRCYNERGVILSADVARACAWRVGLPAFIRASVIFFIVCKFQLSAFQIYIYSI